MIVNKCSEILLAKSKKLYGNYRDNCTVVQRMLEKYKKLYPNISDYSIMHLSTLQNSVISSIVPICAILPIVSGQNNISS